MKETIQMTLNFDTKIEKESESIEHNLTKRFDFNPLFDNITDLKQMHNHNSMAILGDSLQILRQMKSNSVHLIFADAPYNIGKDFGNPLGPV